MTKPGTKPKPPALKAIDGSRPRSKSKDKKTAALAKKLASDHVAAPGHFTQREMEKFDLISGRLKEINVLSENFAEVHGICAQRLAQIEELSEQLEHDGMTYESLNASGGLMIKAHPAATLRNDAFRHAQSLLSEMGLTHTAISKLAGADPNKPKGNPFGRF